MSDTIPSDRGGPVEARDLTVEENADQELTGYEPTSVPFDPRPQQEQIRGWVTVGLATLLGLVILAAFVTIWFRPASVENLESLLTIVFGPLVALVSAATGYYFGGKSN